MIIPFLFAAECKQTPVPPNPPSPEANGGLNGFGGSTGGTADSLGGSSSGGVVVVSNGGTEDPGVAGTRIHAECKKYCQHMRDNNCPVAKNTPEGNPCERICENTIDHHIPHTSGYWICVATVSGCDTSKCK